MLIVKMTSIILTGQWISQYVRLLRQHSASHMLES